MHQILYGCCFHKPLVFVTTLQGFPEGLSRWRIHLQCRRPGFDPGVGKIPWRRAWQLISSILTWRIPKDRGAWQAALHGVAKSQTQLRDQAHNHLARQVAYSHLTDEEAQAQRKELTCPRARVAKWESGLSNALMLLLLNSRPHWMGSTSLDSYFTAHLLSYHITS